MPDRAGLNRSLERRLGVRVVEHVAIDSTMRAAVEDRGPAPAIHRAVLQMAGRGRRGRDWESLPGNLHATIRWPERNPFPPGLLGAVQIEWTRAILTAGGPEVRCKWPNDGWLEGAKWSGVLAARPAERPGEIHLGLGANLDVAPAVAGAGCLRAAWPLWPGADEVSALLLAAAPRVLHDGPDGVGSRLSEWPRHDALSPGERVAVEGAEGPAQGEYRGIDRSGRLRLGLPTGEVRLASGEVHQLRRA